jgi:hypothetical protein
VAEKDIGIGAKNASTIIANQSLGRESHGANIVMEKGKRRTCP